MKQFLLMSLSAFTFAGAMIACGSNSGSGSQAAPVGAPGIVATNGVCPAGYLNTPYNCLPQSTCPAGQAMYGASCIAGTYGTGSTYGNGQQCPIGDLITQYGCLPPGGCAANQAMYNGTCVPGTPSTATGTGYAGGATNCQAQPGYLPTNVGCMPQLGCPIGSASYQGSCIPVIVNGGGTGYGGGYYPNGYNNVYYPQGYSQGYPYYPQPTGWGGGLYFRL